MEKGGLESKDGNGRPRRRYPRVRRRRPVMVRRPGDNGAVAFGHLETLGWGGALLHLDEPIPDASDTEVAICLAGGAIRARARVLYHLREGEGVAVGIEFLEVDDDSVDLLGHLVTPRRHVPRRHLAPRAERWPFLVFGPASPPRLTL